MTRLAAFLALVRKEGAAAASRWRRGGTAPPHTSHTWRRKRSRRGEVRGREGGRGGGGGRGRGWGGNGWGDGGRWNERKRWGYVRRENGKGGRRRRGRGGARPPAGPPCCS